MTENERKIFNLQDVVVALVSISEDVVSKEEFQRIDDKGAEIINCLSELKSYRAIGTIDEFKALKESEEQGLLLRLPYPLDTKKVYALDEAYDGVCYITELDARDLCIDKSDISDRTIFIIDTFEYYEEDFGKLVFLTMEEAEQALEAMKGGAE